jgi:hypothetical protein
MPPADHYFYVRVTEDIAFRDVPARAPFDNESAVREGKVKRLPTGIQNPEEFRFRDFGRGGGSFVSGGVALFFFIIGIFFRLSYSHILDRTFFICRKNIRPAPDEDKNARRNVRSAYRRGFPPFNERRDPFDREKREVLPGTLYRMDEYDSERNVYDPKRGR